MRGWVDKTVNTLVFVTQSTAVHRLVEIATFVCTTYIDLANDSY